MSDDAQSKRERQKARREVKVAAEQQQAAKARRSRFALLGLVVLLVIGAVGWVVVDRQRQAAANEARVAAGASEAANVGCTDIAEQPDQGAGHLATDPAALAANGPDTLYPDRPATSGQHYPSWVISGFYDKPIDERLLVHNLEHGYVNFYYGPDAPQEQVTALQEYAQQEIEDEGGRRKVVVAPWDQPLPDGANFATVAWNQRQYCERFDTTVAEAFVTEFTSSEAAPERFLEPHLTAEQGIDPNAEEGPLLFPPLSEDAPPSGAPQTDQDADQSEVDAATDGGSGAPTGAGSEAPAEDAS